MRHGAQVKAMWACMATALGISSFTFSFVEGSIACAEIMRVAGAASVHVA